MTDADPSGRPVTPPPRAFVPADGPLTPEQVRRVEINRLKGGFTPFGIAIVITALIEAS
jgi:hypothetical protein